MISKITFRSLLASILLLGVAAWSVRAAPASSLHTAQVLSPTVPEVLPAFEALLSGDNEVPPVETSASGRAVLVLDSATASLFYRVMVNDIENITAAHIHIGSPSENGPPVFTLFDGSGTFDPDNPVSGSTVPLTAEQITNLIAGNYYVNVHTTQNPDGEIRGQAGLMLPPSIYVTQLSGLKEVPPVDTPASGSARFTLNFGQDALEYRIVVRDIENITAAHLHTGWPDETGPAVITLFDGTGVFDPDNPLEGSTSLTAQNLLDLLTGFLYANVHTADQPDGEIRGQLGSGFLAFEGKLSGAGAVPSVGTFAVGRATMVLDQQTLHYRVTVTDIEAISAARILKGAPGETGTVVFTIFDGTGDFGPGQPLSGSLTLDSEQIDDLVAGDYHLVITTSAHPDGEIRGQLNAFNVLDFNALLSGSAEVPPVVTPASGVATFTLPAGLDSLDYEVAVRDIAGITASHIHTGWPHENGPIIITLFDGTGTFDPANPISGTAALAAENLLDLISGYYYVNVHTSMHPAGEIRGQIGHGYHAFEARLLGAHEIPVVTTQASGNAHMVLDLSTNTLHYRVVVRDIQNITAAHIHLGQTWENGPVLFTLYDGTGVFDPDNPVTGSIALTTGQAADLVSGRYYVNVHTTANPDGEIRGQLFTFVATSKFNAELSGLNEVPPVQTNASGLAEFRLFDQMTQLHFHISVANIINISAAHIHTGWPQEVGPVVIPLYTGVGDFSPGSPVSGVVNLTAEHVLDMLSGYHYVNVHTQAYPDGEIRGQVQPLLEIYLPIVFHNAE